MNNFFEELLVVLVIYKMKISESPAYHSLTNAMAVSTNSTSLFIYDNSPMPQEIQTSSNWLVHYIHDARNSGVSKAYNEGFKIAKAKGKKWLMLVDQDTGFPANAFIEYQKSIDQSHLRIITPILTDQFGIVSPFKFSFGGGKRVSNLQGGVILKLDDFFFINSGMLISVDCFGEISGYDEQFFLDFSDVDFVCRLRDKNDSFALANFKCRHDLTTTAVVPSEAVLKRFLNYAHASTAFKNKHPRVRWLSIRVFLQAIKLSWRSKDFGFIIAFLKVGHD